MEEGEPRPRGRSAAGKLPRCPQAPRAQPPFQTAPGRGAWALGQGPACRGEAATPLPIHTRTESARPGNGKPEKKPKGEEERGFKWEQQTGVYMSTSLRARSTQKRVLWLEVLVVLSLAWEACGCVHLGCRVGSGGGGRTQRGLRSPTPTPRAEQTPPAAALQSGRRQGLGRRESQAGKGAEKAKKRRSTRKIYWAEQMHRGG